MAKASTGLRTVSQKKKAVFIVMILILVNVPQENFAQGSLKYFESNTLAQTSFAEVAAGKEDTSIAFFRHFYSSEFSFLNTTYHGSFELKGAVNRRGLKTGIWEIYRINAKKKRMLFARGRYLPLSLSRVTVDPVIFENTPQPIKDSLKRQFWMETDFNAIDFPHGVWYFFGYPYKLKGEYQLNANYIMASFARLSGDSSITLRPFDFFTLFEGVQKEYDDRGLLSDSSVYKKYNEGICYKFGTSTALYKQISYYIFKHDKAMFEEIMDKDSINMIKKEEVSQ